MRSRLEPPRESLEEISRVEVLADLAWGPMDAKEAAAFIKTSEANFNRLAPSIPRCKKTGLGFRYLRSDVLAWLRSGSNAAALEAVREELRQRSRPDANAAPVGVGRGKKDGGSGPVKRLV